MLIESSPPEGAFCNTGHVSTLAGTCGHPGEADGDADSAFFSTGIEDIACQQDCTLFVTDRGNRKVRTIHLDEQACPTPPGPTKSGVLLLHI